jgi:hypothetical protein
VNGWVVGQQSNGTSSANSTGSADMKTTQCWHHCECVEACVNNSSYHSTPMCVL